MISHAQNREDLILAGLLKSVQEGFYVDVGANHPEHDSVTLHFYERGWCGINIEPNTALHGLLQQQRPRDVNLCLGIGAAPGRLKYRCYPQRHGLSTFAHNAHARSEQDLPSVPYVDVDCEVRTLAEVLAAHAAAREIHFVKIDVEGLELEVLLGNDWARFRPWVACIERTLDTARTAATMALLEAQDYRSVFFDGLNDYWVRNDLPGLWEGFSYAGAVILSGATRPPPVEVPTFSPAKLLQLEGAAFVDAAYQTMLGRTPDAGGRAHYLEALAKGTGKLAVLHHLAGSREAADRGLGGLARWLPPLPAQPSVPGSRSWLKRWFRH